VRRLITRVLTSRGSTCETAENGQEALDMMRKVMSPAGGDEPGKGREEKPYFDFVMMDFVMVSIMFLLHIVFVYLTVSTSTLQPVMDGPSATMRIRELGYRGPIVGVTGNMMQGDVEHFMRCGATVVLPKPLLLQDLEQFLQCYKNGHIISPTPIQNEAH
jgi:CheY-like chemotaxis protein